MLYFFGCRVSGDLFNQRKEMSSTMLGKGGNKDRHAPKFCVAAVRKDIFYATQKDIFQPVNEKDLGKVANTVVSGFL